MAIYRFIPIKKGKDNEKESFEEVGESEEVAQAEWKSYFGLDVYSNLQFPAGQYKTLDNETIQFEGIRIDTVIMSVSQQKEIVKTKVQGRAGTVKQYISDGDFVVSVSGILTGKSNDSGNNNFTVEGSLAVPEEEIRKFIAICKVPQEMDVVSQFLDFFDISTVVIDEYNFQQKEGSQNEIVFNLRMSSDLPLELT